CYEQILENAQRKTLTTPIFFKNVIPSLINRLRSAYEGMVGIGEIPLYTLEELQLIEKASTLYHNKVEEYVEAINKLSDEKVLKNLRKEALEQTLVDNEVQISSLQSSIATSGNCVEKKDAQTSLSQLPEKLDTVIRMSEAGLDSTV